MTLHPTTTCNPTTCDWCHSPIARGQMVYFAVREQNADGDRYAIGCSEECRKKLETQPEEVPDVRD